MIETFAKGINFLFGKAIQKGKVAVGSSLKYLSRKRKIDSNYFEEYKCILIEEAKTSVMIEPGVISIYPMFKKDNPTQVRILEIYANREAYKLHLETSHFLKYKRTTLKMVKSLQLLDMESIDPETMPEIFCKMKIR